MRIRQLILTAQDEASKFKASVEFTHKNAHPIMIITWNAKVRKVALCSTPRSGDNVLHWTRQQVRRLIKEMELCS